MLRIALGQVDSRLGDIDGNVTHLLEAWQHAADAGADLVVFTELAVTGYPLEDLLLEPELARASEQAMDRLAAEGPGGTAAIVGHVGAPGEVSDATDTERWDVALTVRNLGNQASVLDDGRRVATYAKQRLPAHGLFDEARYFTPGDGPGVVRIAGVDVGIVIGDDLWSDSGPVGGAVAAGAQVLVALNASPYHRGKRNEREQWVRRHATDDGLWVAYVNTTGGHDEVVFDGDSMLVDPTGTVVARGAQFGPDLVLADLEVAMAPGPAPDGDGIRGPGTDRRPLPVPEPAPRLDPAAEVYAALVCATRDYCDHNGFDEALLGLSGGIDSALTLTVAVDALGPDRVTTVAMPSAWSTEHAETDAEAQAEALGVDHLVLPIAGPLEAVARELGELVVTDWDAGAGVAYENMQARLRGLYLMTLANERDAIVLTTGNKSEYAVGYATLYGDMVGGFAPLKDVPKTLVYELARWRNLDGEVIPAAVIDKPPSAELRPDQTDEDSLPPYEVLDDIVAADVEADESIDEIVARGHDEALVREMLRKIDRAEFKRRQAAPGPQITTRAFGRGRRVPMTHGWRR